MNDYNATLTLIEQVWEQIDKDSTRGLDQKRAAVRAKYKSLRCMLAHDSPLEKREPGDNCDLSMIHVSETAVVLAIRLLLFVALACDYFSDVQSSRPLTDEEESVGHLLSALLEKAERALPRIGNQGQERENST